MAKYSNRKWLNERNQKIMWVGIIAAWYAYTIADSITATSTDFVFGTVTFAAAYMNSVLILAYIILSTYLSALAMKKLFSGSVPKQKITSIIVVALVALWYAYTKFNGSTIISTDWSLGSTNVFTIKAAFLNNVAIMATMVIIAYCAGLAVKKVFKR